MIRCPIDCPMFKFLVAQRVDVQNVQFLTLSALIFRCLLFRFSVCNTRVYNLISVPQITQLLLEDAIISSKTEPANGSKNENRSYGEVRNNKAMLKILLLTRILYLKQQSNILRSF